MKVMEQNNEKKVIFVKLKMNPARVSFISQSCFTENMIGK